MNRQTVPAAAANARRKALSVRLVICVLPCRCDHSLIVMCGLGPVTAGEGPHALFLPRVADRRRCCPSLHFDTREQFDVAGLSTSFHEPPTMVPLAGIIAAPILPQRIFCILLILKA